MSKIKPVLLAVGTNGMATLVDDQGRIWTQVDDSFVQLVLPEEPFILV